MALDAAALDISIDYAVMEKVKKVAVIPVSVWFDGRDIDYWSVFAELAAPDSLGNRASCETVFVDANNCFTQNDSRMIAVVGVSDLFIVDPRIPF